MDSSNCCVPSSSPLVGLFCPLPSTTRGEPCVLDGCYGGGVVSGNNHSPLLLYGSGRLVVVRNLSSELQSEENKLTQNALMQGFVYRGHSAHVTVARFSPSGSYVCSADARGCLRVWSYDSEEHLCKLNLPQLLAGSIRDLAWDGEGRRICVVGESSSSFPKGGAQSSAKVVQWDTGVSCGELGQHVTRKRVLSCDFNSKRPLRCITAGEDAKVIFNGNTPISRIVLDERDSDVITKGHTRPVNCVRFSPDGLWICSVGGDKILRLYHGKKGQCVFEKHSCHDAAIYAVSWSSDSKMILTCSADGTAKAWMIRGVPDDVASVFIDCAHIWNVAAQEFQLVLCERKHVSISPTSSVNTPSPNSTAPKGGVLCGCAFLYPSNQPIVASANGNLTLLPTLSSIGGEDQPYALVTVKPKPVVITGHQGNIQAMDVFGNLCYTADVDGIIVEWNLSSGKSSRFIPSLEVGEEEDLSYKVHRASITGLTVMPNGDVCSVGWDDCFRISCCRMQQPRCTRHVTFHSKKLSSQPSTLARGTFLVVVIVTSGLFLYSDGSHSLEEISLPYEPFSVAVSRDDALVAVGDRQGDIHIYEVSNGRLNHKLSVKGAHFKGVSALAFSSDASLLASADVRDVCIWNAKDNYTPVVVKNRWCFHTQTIQCLAWAPHTNVLASGGLDDSIYIWCVEKKMIRIGYPFSHRGGVVGIAFCNGGKWLVSSGKDGCVCQWNIEADVKKKFGITL